jgi:hypothetical protein
MYAIADDVHPDYFSISAAVPWAYELIERSYAEPRQKFAPHPDTLARSEALQATKRRKVERQRMLTIKALVACELVKTYAAEEDRRQRTELESFADRYMNASPEERRALRDQMMGDEPEGTE